MITAVYTGEKVHSASAEAFSLNERSQLGEKKNSKVEYSKVETLYLLDEKKLKLYKNSKELSYDKFLSLARKEDKKIEIKLNVFADLRKKGYLVKSALKFGAEFRVYEKGSLQGEQHAKWIVFVSRESENFNWHDFAAKNRVAHSTKKNLLIAIVDEESDISYYEVEWLRP